MEKNSLQVCKFCHAGFLFRNSNAQIYCSDKCARIAKTFKENARRLEVGGGRPMAHGQKFNWWNGRELIQIECQVGIDGKRWFRKVLVASK